MWGYVDAFVYCFYGESASLYHSRFLYAFLGRDFLGLLTNDTSVIEASGDYFYWVLAIPLCGFSAFLWDGIFIGATATRQMLYSMLVGLGLLSLLFITCFYRSMGNHALWMAFLGYLSLRGGMQWILWRYRKITMPIISN